MLEKPEMEPMKRFEQIIQEWRDAGIGAGEYVQERARIESEQAQARRVWKRRKLGASSQQQPAPLLSIDDRVGVGLCIEELD